MVHFINLYWLKPITKYFSVTSNHLEYTRSSRPEVFCKKVVLRNFAKFTGKQLCQRPQACIFIKKETLAQVFSCEFCEIFKNTLFTSPPDECFCQVKKQFSEAAVRRLQLLKIS